MDFVYHSTLALRVIKKKRSSGFRVSGFEFSDFGVKSFGYQMRTVLRGRDGKVLAQLLQVRDRLRAVPAPRVKRRLRVSGFGFWISGFRFRVLTMPDLVTAPVDNLPG